MSRMRRLWLWVIAISVPLAAVAIVSPHIAGQGGGVRGRTTTHARPPTISPTSATEPARRRVPGKSMVWARTPAARAWARNRLRRLGGAGANKTGTIGCEEQRSADPDDGRDESATRQE